MAQRIGGAEFTGKIGSNVHGVNGVVRRLRVSPNGQSVKQIGSRSRLSLLSTQYRDLTPAQQDSWKQAALNYPRTNKAGIAKRTSGSQLFIQVNGLALTLKEQLGDGSDNLTTPPVPTTVSTSQITSVTTGLNLLFSGTVTATEKLVIYASRGQSSGTRRATSMKLIASLKTADIVTVLGPPETNTASLSTEYAAVYGTPQAGLNIFFEAYIVSNLEMIKRPAGSGFTTTV